MATAATVTFGRLLKEARATYGTLPAIEVTDGRTLTYEDWHQRADLAARALMSMRLTRLSDPVMIVWDGDWIAYAVSVVAVQMAGRIGVPATMAMGESLLDQISRRADARICIGGPVRDLGYGGKHLYHNDLLHPSMHRGELPEQDHSETYYGVDLKPSHVSGETLASELPDMRHDAEHLTAVHCVWGGTSDARRMLLRALSPCRWRVIVQPAWDRHEALRTVAATGARDLLIMSEHAADLSLIDPDKIDDDVRTGLRRIEYSGQPSTDVRDRLQARFPNTRLVWRLPSH